MTVVVIGPPAAGKTSVGRELAARLGVRFVDTDDVIVSQHGPIPQIFASRGEPWFRRVERAAVARSLAAGGVVSLGGGAPLDAETAGLLADHRVILLTVDVPSAAARIGGGGRPLVGDIDSWRDLVERRMPAYRALAKRTIDTSGRAVDELADELAQWVRGAAKAAEEAGA
ncbi:MAG TPA: shikimate kinase [Microbacteriaceae bacterium]|nr:shikimate kinase [Microbacteriaceae bacterium]